MMTDIVEKRIEMKPYFSVEAKSLLQGLLDKDPVRRLGASEEDASEIKRHPWFAKINWDKLVKKQIEPPYKPMVTSTEDTRNIDRMFLNEPAKDTPQAYELSPNAKQRNHFDQFTYVGGNHESNNFTDASKREHSGTRSGMNGVVGNKANNGGSTMNGNVTGLLGANYS